MSDKVTRNNVETVLREALILGNLTKEDKEFLKEIIEESEYDCMEDNKDCYNIEDINRLHDLKRHIIRVSNVKFKFGTLKLLFY